LDSGGKKGKGPCRIHLVPLPFFLHKYNVRTCPYQELSLWDVDGTGGGPGGGVKMRLGLSTSLPTEGVGISARETGYAPRRHHTAWYLVHDNPQAEAYLCRYFKYLGPKEERGVR
jgi:hypothetical protein